MRSIQYLSLFATVFAFATANAQTPAADPSDKLREVLPTDVADRVIARIAEARARQLPAAALENRALKFAARGVPASEIEKSINDHASKMMQAKSAIERGRSSKAQGDEIDAGAEAMRKGVDGAAISKLASETPSGRSLAVPFEVISSLVDRGLPSDAALLRVQEKLLARASDSELRALPGEAQKPAATGQYLADTKRPANAGRPAAAGVPAGVPVNPGTSTSGAPRPSAPVTKRP